MKNNQKRHKMVEGKRTKEKMCGREKRERERLERQIGFDI